MRRLFGKRISEVDELIHRSLCGELTRDEAERLAAWRHESLANEQQYRRSARLIHAMAQTVVRDRQPPSVLALLAGNRGTTPRVRRLSRMRVTAARLAAAGLVIAAVSASYVYRHRVTNTPSPARADVALADGVGYSTGPSEMATVQLSDGSVVQLAPNSQLHFVQRSATREARLEGRAFFSVAKIPGRAFHVHTRFGDATVLGTRFELATASTGLSLLVVSGRVGLAGRTNQVEVHGGEVSSVHDGTVAEPTRLPNAATMKDWVGKFLAFQSTPMHEVAREIEETYGVRVTVEDSLIDNRTVTGTFTDRDVHDVVDVICSVVIARCSTRAGEVVMTSP